MFRLLVWSQFEEKNAEIMVENLYYYIRTILVAELAFVLVVFSVALRSVFVSVEQQDKMRALSNGSVDN
jgi:hypothetical protein